MKKNYIFENMFRLMSLQIHSLFANNFYLIAIKLILGMPCFTTREAVILFIIRCHLVTFQGKHRPLFLTFHYIVSNMILCLETQS